MVRRKGLGKGRGMGYKNLIPKDKSVHSDSAKGKKQPQKEPKFIPYKKGKRSGKYTAEEKEIIDALGKDTLNALKEFKSSKIEEFGDYYGDSDSYIVKFEDGEEYRIFENEEQAESVAEDQVREDLENEPSLFDQDWLRQHYSMSDTDRRMIAGEEADNRLEGMDDDEIIEEYGEREDYDEIQEKIDALEEKFDDDLSPTDEQRNQDAIDQYEDDKQQLVEDAREEAQDQIYDEVYDALEDPYNYFVEEQGMYSAEDFFNANFMSLDVEDAVEDAIAQDGWAHFISRYDGDYTELEDGTIIVREN